MKFTLALEIEMTEEVEQGQSLHGCVPTYKQRARSAIVKVSRQCSRVRKVVRTWSENCPLSRDVD
jgi:organic hydroperoxide reductase OsmC/OhrA